MSIDRFDGSAWEERLSDALENLRKVQKPFLDRYWQANGYPTQVSWNGRDETPFPSDDLLMLYQDVRRRFDKRQDHFYQPLRAALDPVRGVLRGHPRLGSALGIRTGNDDFHMGILNGSTLTSLSGLIVGQMANRDTHSEAGFQETAAKLNSLLLLPDRKFSALQTGLNVGMDIALFYGVYIDSEVDLGEGYSLIPFSHLSDYVDPTWLTDVAPEHVEHRRTESIFGVVRRFVWKPMIRPKQSHWHSEPRTPPPLFHRWVEEFANLLAVSLGTRVSWMRTLEGCVSLTAADLLGNSYHPNMTQKGRSISHLFDPFAKVRSACPERVGNAKFLFSRKSETAYADLASEVYRLAEAYCRDSRFAAHDRVLDLAIVFERMFQPPGRGISNFLQNEIAELLGQSEEERERLKAEVKHFYEVRSAIIHGPSGEKKSQRLRETAQAWENGVRIAREALLRKLQ